MVNELLLLQLSNIPLPYPLRCRHQRNLVAKSCSCLDVVAEMTLVGKMACRVRPRQGAMGEWLGVSIALLSSCLGGTAAAVTRRDQLHRRRRASLALSTQPLQTMLIAALLGVEPPTARKSAGVGIAVFGVVARAGIGSLSRATGGLARGIDHDRRGVLHGLLQCPVAPLHRTIECPGIPWRSAWGRARRR
jgi:hypothetical protein